MSLFVGLATGTEASARAGAASTVVHVRCSVGGRHGLIAAIRAANRRGGGVLRLARRCTYILRRPDNKTDGGNGLPVLAGRITLQGQAGTTIARSKASGTPHFRIVEAGEHGTVAIKHLTISGGRFAGPESQGGGIANEGTITSLSHDSIRRNKAGAGGGIYNNGTIGHLDHDRISHNTAGNGGGVFNLGKIRTFQQDTVSGNRAGIGAGITNGGGSILSLNHSTISNNHLTANGAGGGIANSFGVLKMSEDVVADNTATAGPQASGGGIDNSGKLTLTGSVVRGNTARGVGGGLRNEEQVAPRFVFAVKSTKVIGNTVTSPAGPATGGGVYNAGEMSIANSAVRSNKALSKGRAVGAGLYNGGSLSVRRTVTKANLVEVPGGAAEGGGLYVDEGSTKTALADSTVTGNRALGAQPHGGGILFAGGAAVMLLGSTVVGNRPDNCYPGGSVTGCSMS